MPSPALHHRRRIGAALEVVEGTDPGITAGDIVSRVVSPSFSHQPLMSDRSIGREAFTMLPDLVAGSIATFQYGLELAGTTNAISVEPHWGRHLRACGFHRGVLTSATIGVITGGPFIHGETLTSDATAAPTAICVKDYYTAASQTMYWEPVTGTIANGDTLTGSRSGATADVSSVPVASIAQGFWPATIPSKTLTVSGGSGTLAVGDEILGATSGARARALRAATASTTSLVLRLIHGSFTASESVSKVGGGWSATVGGTNPLAAADVPTLTLYGYKDGRILKATGCRGDCSLQFDHGTRALINTTMQGRFVEEVDGIHPNLSNLYQSKVPPVFLGAQFSITNPTAAKTLSVARINSLALAIGNNAIVRPDANEASGYAPCEIVGRATTASWDPEQVDGDVYDFMSQFVNGQNAYASFLIGTVAENILEFFLPNVQFSGIADSGRNEIVVLDASAKMNGGLYVSNTVYNGDNEVVIILR